MIPTKKLAILCTAVCAAMFAFSHNATALTINDTHTLGDVQFGIPSGDQDRVNYVNDLVYMYNTGLTTYSHNGQNYQIVNGAPAFGASLSNATFVALNGTSLSINLGAQGTYTYLFAKYDNTAAGSVVWYVGNLSGPITIPARWGQYGLSGWSLLGTGNVPDSGATVMLLGAALGALGMMRRYLTS